MASTRDVRFEEYVNRSFNRIRGAPTGAVRARFMSAYKNHPMFRRLLNKRPTERFDQSELGIYLRKLCGYDSYTAAKVATFWWPSNYQHVYDQLQELGPNPWAARRTSYNPRARGDFVY